MADLYTLFTEHYSVEPITYRLGTTYTIRDIVILLAKSHAISINGVGISVGRDSGTIIYGNKTATISIGDILYVIAKLYNSGGLVDEEPLELTTFIPVEIQTIIYKSAKRTGTIAQLSKTTQLITNTFVLELCNEPITIDEVEKYMESPNILQVVATTKQVLPNTVKTGTIYVRNTTINYTVGMWFSVETDISSGIVNSSFTDLAREGTGDLKPTLVYFFKQMEEIYYNIQLQILARRTQCLSIKNYAREYVAKYIATLWNVAKRGTTLDLRVFFQRGNLLAFFNLYTLDRHTTQSQQLQVEIGTSLSWTLKEMLAANKPTKDIVTVMDMYVTSVLQYLRL